MTYSGVEIWTIIALMAVGTFVIRFSFLGWISGRELPPWLLRHLRYAPVAILPGLVAPLAVWPAATGGTPDPARLAAVCVTALVGWKSKNLPLAITAGALTLFLGLKFLG